MASLFGRLREANAALRCANKRLFEHGTSDDSSDVTSDESSDATIIKQVAAKEIELGLHSSLRFGQAFNTIKEYKYKNDISFGLREACFNEALELQSTLDVSKFGQAFKAIKEYKYKNDISFGLRGACFDEALELHSTLDVSKFGQAFKAIKEYKYKNDISFGLREACFNEALELHSTLDVSKFGQAFKAIKEYKYNNDISFGLRGACFKEALELHCTLDVLKFGHAFEILQEFKYKNDISFGDRREACFKEALKRYPMFDVGNESEVGGALCRRGLKRGFEQHREAKRIRLSSAQCFLPNTLLLMDDGSLRKVAEIGTGEMIRSRNGTATRVVFNNHAESKQREVVEIITRKGSHKFTADHRVAVTLDGGITLEGQVASSLAKGINVFIGQELADITNVKHYKIDTPVVEMHFDPDTGVESHMISKHGGIITFGGKFPDTPRDGF